MLSRRSALAAFAALLAVPTAALAQAPGKPATPVANDPTALLTAIYTKAAKDNSGGDLYDAKVRAKYLSKSFAALWRKAEAATPKGDSGPVDFDPVSNSQDPDIASFAIKVEKQDDATATLAVTLKGTQPRKVAADEVIRYDFVRDGGHWRIDDIRGSIDGKAWSIRANLAMSLKN